MFYMYFSGVNVLPIYFCVGENVQPRFFFDGKVEGANVLGSKLPEQTSGGQRSTGKLPFPNNRNRRDLVLFRQQSLTILYSVMA